MSEAGLFYTLFCFQWPIVSSRLPLISLLSYSQKSLSSKIILINVILKEEISLFTRKENLLLLLLIFYCWDKWLSKITQTSKRVSNEQIKRDTFLPCFHHRYQVTNYGLGGLCETHMDSQVGILNQNPKLKYVIMMNTFILLLLIMKFLK